MKKGVESWQPAFEAAGFKNAIIAKEAPTAEQDPDWSPEDARYSVIRWLPSTIENASGPHIHDPRTGEILESDIQFYHNVMNLARDWYFVQVGPLDPRAKTLPLPDDLMGRLIEYVVAHEVGHTLGFQHNMKASSMYPAAKRPRRAVGQDDGPHADADGLLALQLRRPARGQDRRRRPRSRNRPVRQVGDDVGLQADSRRRRRPRTRRRRSTSGRASRTRQPWLRFSTAGSRGADPGELTEAVGDEDAVASTTLGLKNLRARRRRCCMPATTTKPGEPYDDLEELYGRMLGQWALEMNHVAAIVGGFNSQQKHVGQEGVRFTPIARDRQAARGRSSSTRTRSQTPAWAIKPEILRRIEPVGVLDRVARRPAARAELAAEQRARRPARRAGDARRRRAPTGRLDFLADVRKGVWSEVYDGATVARSTPTAATCSAPTSRRSAERINGRPGRRRRRARVLPRRAEDARRRPADRAERDDRPRDAPAHRGRPDPDRPRARPLGAGIGRRRPRDDRLRRQPVRSEHRSGSVLGGLRDQGKEVGQLSAVSRQLSALLVVDG